MAKEIKYVEPLDYFPKSVRKKNKIGEYAETKTETNNKKANNTSNKNK